MGNGHHDTHLFEPLFFSARLDELILIHFLSFMSIAISVCPVSKKKKKKMLGLIFNGCDQKNKQIGRATYFKLRISSPSASTLDQSETKAPKFDMTIGLGSVTKQAKAVASSFRS
jgi:hypothetical protein